ncbi:MAG: TraX family protein [bacterium]|nr:TraX family protein [bacterium]
MKKFSLSSTGIKLVAILAMVIDHVGLLFFPHQLLWRVAGRIAFPLFAFLVAEGALRTSNVRAYLFRLLGFAIISQFAYIPFNGATGGILSPFNIFFTLSAGLLALILWKRLPRTISVPAIILLCALADILSFDYGAYGVLTVLISNLALQRRKLGITALLLFPQAVTLLRFALGAISIQGYASMSVPLVAIYNGERGRKLPRHLFYWFYPVHLLVLASIWYLK